MWRRREPIEERKLTRRSFLAWGIGAIGAFMATVLSIPLVGFLISPALKGKKAAPWVRVGPLSDFRVNEPKLAEFTIFTKDGWMERPQKKAAWVVRKGEQEFIVFNARCTHLGCIFNWEADKAIFRSPCHNGTFSIEGKVLGGPPPRPLDTLEHRLEGGDLVTEYKDFRLGIPEKIEV